MKKIFLFALMTLVSALQGWAFDFEVDGIYYTITSSGTVSVVKGTYDYDGDVTIPKTVSNGVETFNVTGIGEGAFKSCGELVSVTMPEGLTSIGNEAFYRSSIKAVSLPSTLSSMGTSAFRECRNLTGVVLPDALKDVKEYAFYQCTNLKAVSLGNQTVTIEKYAFMDTPIENLVIPSSTRTIAPCAFVQCSKLKSLIINNAPVAIGWAAFGRCSNLEEVNLGSKTYDLGNILRGENYGAGVFNGCTNLKSISLPSSLTSTGYCTFEGCSKLYNVTLPNTIEEIGERSFLGCAIGEIDLPSCLNIIGSNAFSGCPLAEINLPSSLKTIGTNAFNGCSFKHIIIPESVTDIDQDAFANCKSLKKVVIDNAPVRMVAAFEECSSLEEIDLGNQIVSIDGIPERWTQYGCFKNCCSLKNINIPNTIKSIGYMAFSGCSQLESVSLPIGLTAIDDYAFNNCVSLCKVNIPNTVQSIGAYAFCHCSSLQNILLPYALSSIGDAAFMDCKSLNDIVIPEHVMNIGVSAFYGCTNLKSLVIDNANTTINRNAFSGCTSLKSVDLGKAVTIQNRAFGNCINLQEVNIPNSVITFGGDDYDGGPFANCSSLKKVVIGTGIMTLSGKSFKNCTKLASVEILGNVLKEIGYEAFINCRNLKKIELPASVTSIERNVFDGCSVLSHIYMNATTPPTIQANTFSDYETPTLHVPSSAKTSYTKADNWKNFTNVIAIGSEPKATAEEIAALDVLLMEAQALYNGSVEGTEPGNYRPGAKAALKAVIDEVEARFNDNMLAEDVEDCMELLNTAIKSFKNKQVKNDIQTNNTLAFAETLKAATGSEFRLPIEMNNTDEITGVQFDLYLPEGMQLSQDEYGDYNIELSERTTARRHSVASRVMPDGALRVVVSSQQNATFSGNSGTLLTLVLFPASTLEAGDYDVELKNVILTDPQANRYAAPDMKSVITVSTYTLGDVNNDGFIDVADLAGVVRFILENADATLIFNAADMDGNGVVEINDYAALVNVILAQDAPQSSSLRKVNAIRNTVISLSDLCLNSNGEGELMVCLDFNDMRYTGLQFDLSLPDGIELMDEGAEAISRQHGAWAQKRADGTYRVICSSMVNDEFREGDVLRLQVKVTGELNGTLDAEASNVVLSDVNAVRHEAASAKATLTTDDATSISELKSNESVNVIFNLAGQRLNKMQRGINIVNGKKIVVK